MLPSTLKIIRPMRLQSLKLLRAMNKEKMHLQESILLEFDLGAKVTQNVA